MLKVLLQILLILCLLTLTGLLIYRGLAAQSPKTQVCPVAAITMENGKAVIDAAKCIGCRRCVDGIVAPIVQPTEDKTLTTQELTQPVLPQNPTPEPSVTTTPKQTVATTQPPIKTPEKAAHAVNPQLCIGCQLCVPRCPTNAITMVNGIAVIDKEKCINCGICVKGNNEDFNGCPVSAITAP